MLRDIIDRHMAKKNAKHCAIGCIAFNNRPSVAGSFLQTPWRLTYLLSHPFAQNLQDTVYPKP